MASPKHPRKQQTIRMLPAVGMSDPAAVLSIIEDLLRKELAERHNSPSPDNPQPIPISTPKLEQPNSSLHILRLPDLERKIGLRKSQIYGLMAAGQFPPAIKLTARVSGWLEHEIDNWLLNRAALRNWHQ